MKKKIIAAASILIIFICVLCAALYMGNKKETKEGTKKVSVEVIHGDGKAETFEYSTEAEFLGEILKENELVEGEEGEYGLFITSVDGEKADDTKEQWWCITKGGAQVNTSVDKTPVQDGDKFELTLTEGY